MKWLNGMMIIMSVGGLTGCANHMTEPTSEQAALGLGIVEGTKGYRYFLAGPTMRNGAVTKVRGQVHHIEGAAYVVHTETQSEVRLPFDENTHIDRPAHKGDWIEAFVNEAGRAMFIQNVDDQIVLE
ncbi:MAG: hypothetical protein WD425_01700 [Nitrospirales bacterium]